MEESYSYGDLNDCHKKYFMTEELRDDYFENVLKAYYMHDSFEEYEPNNFHEKNENRQRWAYNIAKGEEMLTIIETKDW